jgi:hypothetical protein
MNFNVRNRPVGAGREWRLSALVAVGGAVAPGSDLLVQQAAAPLGRRRLPILAHPAMVAVKKTNNAEALNGLDLFMSCSFMFN